MQTSGLLKIGGDVVFSWIIEQNLGQMEFLDIQAPLLIYFCFFWVGRSGREKSRLRNALEGSSSISCCFFEFFSCVFWLHF